MQRTQIPWGRYFKKKNILHFARIFFRHQDCLDQTLQGLFLLFLTLHMCTLADNCRDSGVITFECNAVKFSAMKYIAMQCKEVVIFLCNPVKCESFGVSDLETS